MKMTVAVEHYSVWHKHETELTELSKKNRTHLEVSWSRGTIETYWNPWFWGPPSLGNLHLTTRFKPAQVMTSRSSSQGAVSDWRQAVKVAVRKDSKPRTASSPVTSITHTTGLWSTPGWWNYMGGHTTFDIYIRYPVILEYAFFQLCSWTRTQLHLEYAHIWVEAILDIWSS